MSTTQSPQDEIAAMQETLARHEEDLERIKRWLPEIDGIVRPLWESIANEITATRDSIRQELTAIHERLDAHTEILNTHTEILNTHTERLDAHTEILNAHTEILNTHTERLDAHTEILNTHTERLDAHTERLDAQAAAQADTNREIASVNGEIASIKETLAVLVERTESMSRALVETNSRVGNLTGTRYERLVARTIRRRLSRDFGLLQTQVLHTDWGETDYRLIAILDEAAEKGAISDGENYDALSADIIAAGQNAAGQRTYAVVEIGVTVNSTHVNRAARRARTLANATGSACTAIVVGSEIPPAEQERAQRSAVAVVSIAEQVD